MDNKIPNKLQIRASVLDIINSYNGEGDYTSPLHTENLQKLKAIPNRAFVLEILLKELECSDVEKIDPIAYILLDFAQIEEIEEKLWEFLQNPDLPDSKKEIYLHILRLMGGKIDVNLLMECFTNFDKVVDEQTKNLLDVAMINPEAQIDFLDFLFLLRADEQIQLLKSLEVDYTGDEMASILSVALKSDLSENVKENIIEILGETKSYLAVSPLKYYITTKENEELRRLAIRALNQLQKDINVDDEEKINMREREICSTSKFFKAFISQVDGDGNQGVIFSRIFEDGNVATFSAVINIADGILDCFGFNALSKQDFQKLVLRFKTDDLVVPLSAGEVKYRLDEAEKISREANLPLPYEYVCWSAYTHDIEPIAADFDKLKISSLENITSEAVDTLYDTEMFDTWFFEYDDNINVKNFVDEVINNTREQDDINIKTVENIIDKYFDMIFTADKIQKYSKMLKEAAFVFFVNKNFEKANIMINLAELIAQNKEQWFLKDVLKRSVLQYLADMVAEEEEKKPENRFAFSKNLNKTKLTAKEAYSLLNRLEAKFDGDDIE